jgi:hypothetical protein
MFDIELIYYDLKQKTLIVSEQTGINFIKKKTGKDENSIELIYNGIILEDDKKLIDYEIKKNTNIYVVVFNNNLNLEIDTIQNQLAYIDNFIHIINNFNNNYLNELSTLNSMGFTNNNRNISLLTLYQGNIESVISILLEEINI